MRRTILLALLAALLLAPTASAAGPIQIIRDCEDDGVLQGSYTASELRDARSKLPTDIDEYSDCRDVLSRAITAATAASKPSPTPSPTDGGGVDQSGGGGGTGSGGGTDSTSRDEERAALLSAPSSPQDAQAVGAAAADGDKAIKAEIAQRDPGATRLAASVGRNGLPTTMIAVLALLAATLVAACLPLIRRRRVLPHPRP
jgi:hypothetical protein